jgi:hypothetical protein
LCGSPLLSPTRLGSCSQSVRSRAVSVLKIPLRVFSSSTRHLLLMIATPHNGKEEDFQLFLSLLDSDRFLTGGPVLMLFGEFDERSR